MTDADSSIEGHRKQLNASKLVLLVDDDLDLLEVTTFVLEGEGFLVETARNGEAALRRLRASRRPDIMLLDLMMPIMNGHELLEEVAKDPSLQEIPVVVLTAAPHARVSGAVEVLYKPIDLRFLVEIVERHVHGAG